MKALIPVVLGYCMLLAACANEVQRNMKEYVDTALPRIMDQQEKKLGITHPNFPVVKILPSPTNGSDAIAEYDTSSGTMNVYSNRNFSEEDVDRSLSHELGHFYNDIFLKSEGFEKGLSSDRTLGIKDLRNRREVLRKRMVGEGIAEYFSRKTLGIAEDCASISLAYDTLRDRFKDRGIESSDLLTNAFLNNSFCLVKPVLDVDLDQGILYLSTHPPPESQLENLKLYQEKAIDDARALAR